MASKSGYVANKRAVGFLCEAGSDRVCATVELDQTPFRQCTAELNSSEPSVR